MCRFSYFLLAAVVFGVGSALPAEPDPYLAVVKGILACVAKRDETSIDGLVDQDAFLEIVRKKNAAGDAAFRQYQKEYRLAGPGLGVQFTELAKNSAFSFFRLRPHGKNMGAVFRGGTSADMNYLELIMTKDARGAVRVLDFYIMTLGTNRSDVEVEEIQSNAGQRPGASQEAMSKVHQALGNGDFKKALAIYNELPPHIAFTRMMMSMRVVAASSVSAKEMEEAAADFDQMFPDSLALAVRMFGLRVLQRRFDEALKIVDKVDAWAGGDPFLDTTRGLVQFQAGKVEEAAALFKKSAQAVPSIAESHRFLIKAQITTKNYPGALEAMKDMSKYFNIDNLNFDTHELFAEVRKLPEFQTWWESRKK
jgi:tetratricopeptide (TPR) repeat protein